MKKSVPILVLFLLLNVPFTYSQSNTKDDVLLFQSFFRDASVHTNIYGEGILTYSDHDFYNSFGLGLQAGIPITPELELGTGLYYRSFSFDSDFWDDETGIADIPVYGRYNFVNEARTKISAGAFLTLPVGNEEIGGGNVDFGIFGAVRHAVSDPVVLTGTLGINFLEHGNSRETSLNLGLGAIIEATDDLHVITELSLETETDYAALSGGVDYAVSATGRLRGGLLLGLNDNAPDFGLFAGFLFHF